MSKRFIGYVLFLIVYFYLAMIFCNYGWYLILYLLFALPFFALAYFLIIRKKTVFSWGRMESAVARGENATIHIALRNDSFLPTGEVLVNITVTDELIGTVTKEKKSLALAGHQTRIVSFQLCLSHAGIVKVAIESVRVYEPLGLFRDVIQSNIEPANYTVMPEISDIPNSLWRHNPYAYIGEEEYSKERPGDDPSVMFGTREYRPGDKQNRIHWNLTAKQDELIVKELGLPVDYSTLVLFDMHQTKDEAILNGLFDTVFSVSKALAAEDHPHTLAWLDAANNCVLSERITKPDQVRPLASVVFKAGLSEKEQSVVSAYLTEHDRDRYKNIYYISSDMGESVEGMLQASRVDAYITCICVSDEGADMDNGEWRIYYVRPNYVAEDLAGKRGNL